MPRPRKQINQINVVPYIDVMLVLLVIFMITAPLINPGVIELPSVGTKLAPAMSPLDITLTKEQTLLLKEGNAVPVRVSRDELIARIKDRQAKNPDQPVTISADRAARYEEVIGLIDMLQRNGVHRVGLLAKPQG